MEARHAPESSFALSRPGSANDQRSTHNGHARPAASIPQPDVHGRQAFPGAGASPSDRAPVTPPGPVLRLRRSDADLDAALDAVAPAPADPAIAGGDLAERIALRLRQAIGPERFAASFANKAVFRVDEGVLEVAAPNKILAGLLERRFGDAVREAARSCCAVAGVRFVVAEDLFGPQAEELGEAASARGAAPDVYVGGALQPRGLGGSPAGVGAGPSSPAPGGAPRLRATPRQALSDRYRLEQFVVGESNRLAYTAALALAESAPGQSVADAKDYSPLFLHGPCGVGKTHLLTGVAIRYKEIHPGATVRVVGAEAFMNEYVASVRAGDVERFRRQYRRVDLLCIDDVHFLSSKQSTQGELLHTLDELQRTGARIVLASDEHPRHIRQFSAALTSRFMAGMVASIAAPDAALREQCVRRFAKMRGLGLDEAAVSLVVGRTAPVPGVAPSSVRDIEGLMVRIDAVHRLTPGFSGEGAHGAGPIGVLTVERAMGNAGAPGDGLPGLGVSTVADPGAPSKASRPVRMDAIILSTCAAMGVEQADLGGKTRHPRVVLARALITHLARQMTTLSYPEIARAIGRPNHSTVITAIQRFAKQLEADEAVDAPGAPEARTLSVLVRQISQGVGAHAARRP